MPTTTYALGFIWHPREEPGSRPAAFAGFPGKGLHRKRSRPVVAARAGGKHTYALFASKGHNSLNSSVARPARAVNDFLGKSLPTAESGAPARTA